MRKSAITPTQKLFRAVPNGDGPNGDGMIKYYEEGNVWFHSHKWFRKIEGGDKMKSNISDEYLRHPAFFMSFSETVEGARSFDRGSESHTLFEVQNPIKLRDEIKNILLNHKFVKITWIKMEYGKTIEVGHELTPSEASERKYRQKPEKYRIEREWRLQILFCRSFRTINDTLKFRWGQDIWNLFEISRENFK